MKPNSEHAPLPADAGEESIASLDKIRNSKGNLHTAEIRRRMQRTMQVGRNVLQPRAAACWLICWALWEETLLADSSHELRTAAVLLKQCCCRWTVHLHRSALQAGTGIHQPCLLHSHTHIVTQQLPITAGLMCIRVDCRALQKCAALASSLHEHRPCSEACRNVASCHISPDACCALRCRLLCDSRLNSSPPCKTHNLWCPAV